MAGGLVGSIDMRVVDIQTEENETKIRYYLVIDSSAPDEFDPSQSVTRRSANQKGAHAGTAQFVFDSDDATMAVGDVVKLELHQYWNGRLS